ncbi:MAG: hypothetical protein ACI8S6_000108 [Myxococcota bacterium]|jgi:hypothetical protein
MWLMLTALLMSTSWADIDDDDGDGIGESAGDCDDRDATVYPGAPEACDGVDDDCDGIIDEGTPCYDDDGDGYQEDEGDCNDADPTINPSALEQLNHLDDDCDGTIDEGTENYDDDGDGLSELEGDCDDDNDLRSPALIDYCRDGIDNDCSGVADDDCTEDLADGCDPELAVLLSASRFSGGGGESVSLDAFPLFDDDLLEAVLAWSVEAGTIEEPDNLTATWILPDEPGRYLVTVIMSDECGFDSLDQLEVLVEDQTTADRTGSYLGGCGTRSAAVLLLPGLLLGWRRRSALSVAAQDR